MNILLREPEPATYIIEGVCVCVCACVCVCVCVCVWCAVLGLEWGPAEILRSCGRKAELLPPFQSYWRGGGDYKNPSPHRVPVSHTDPSPSCSLGNFPQIRKRTVKRICHGKRVFTITTQRTLECAFTSLQLNSIDQLHTSAPRRVASIRLPPMGSQIPTTQHRIPVI